MNRGSSRCNFTTQYSGVRSSALPCTRPGGANAVSRSKKNSRRLSKGGLQLMLLGICTAVFMLMFVIKVIGSDNAADIVSAMRELQNTEGDNAERDDAEQTLGRLRLVRLPSIIEVFSPSDSPIRPLVFDGAIEDDSTLIAKLYAPAGTEVSSILPGTVKSVSVDESLGGYVAVSHPNDIEVYYYGLTDISVERGQPLLQNSTIGRLYSDFLCIRVLERGRPIDPLKFLGVEAEVG